MYLHSTLLLLIVNPMPINHPLLLLLNKKLPFFRI